MKVLSIIKYLFTAIGLGLLIGTFYLYTNTQAFVKDALPAEGTVIKLLRSESSDSTTYRPVVEFKTQSGSVIEFTSSMGSNPPGYSKGETVEVLYRQSSPEKARIKSFFSLWGVSIIVGTLGSIFFLVGFSIIFFDKKKSRNIEYLKRHGTPVRAKNPRVEINGLYEVNGRHPYHICAQWKNPATSEIHIFNSENIWFDPTEYMKDDEITVLIEQDNPKKYYVDISFLPVLAS